MIWCLKLAAYTYYNLEYYIMFKKTGLKFGHRRLQTYLPDNNNPNKLAKKVRLIRQNNNDKGH